MKVLIVDDSQFIRDTIKKRTEDLNLQIYEADDADSAIKSYKENLPDLVLMDIMMKKEDEGVIAIRAIKKINPKANIIVITSLGESDPYVKDAIDLGVLDVITKPFNKEEIFKYLEHDVNLENSF